MTKETWEPQDHIGAYIKLVRGEKTYDCTTSITRNRVSTCSLSPDEIWTKGQEVRLISRREELRQPIVRQNKMNIIY